ncbi:RNA polymerase sigma factor [Winogradskyella tangerina]|uniref:RNA polymerase sigma factor n=1 Tax=Winogradskyella tangerina TaxID=2023240 RepID=UPI000DBE8006|nr:sigma-70 family RNA polymerase sigma factor [Winogradskyella tangerina]
MKLEKLIKGCKKQSLKAQAELYQLYKDNLFSICLKYCRNREEAQDNLQDAFIEIFSKIKSYKGNGSFEGWMKRITINKAIDKYKKDKTVNITINDNIMMDTSIESGTLEVIPLEDVLNIIQELPPKYRLVFNLYELDGYSHKEISDLLQISINTSKSNLHRAKGILKTKIQQSLQLTHQNQTSNGI